MAQLCGISKSLRTNLLIFSVQSNLVQHPPDLGRSVCSLRYPVFVMLYLNLSAIRVKWCESLIRCAYESKIAWQEVFLWVSAGGNSDPILTPAQGTFIRL